ncbi:MAG: 4-oxalocrotonate decarboxylase [Thioploca sp.]|nr:4-oxalocrotonate decarboxylase [Thioploca sp.]
MKSFLRYLILTIALVSFNLLAGELELAEQLNQSQIHHQPIPLVSLIQPELSIAQAYKIQRYYVQSQLGNDQPAGFKSGLTSAATQNKFNVNQPVSGILFTKGDLSGIKTIKLAKFDQLRLETEIGFEIGTAIEKTLSDEKQLKQHIKAIFPAIELPEVNFTKQPTGIDIIAANIGAKAYIKGKAVTDFTLMDLNTLSVTLTKDGKIVNSGKGDEVLNDQWQAALWLVNQLVAQGWSLMPGQFLITGVIGKMVKAEVGHYQADFGKLGKITVAIIP